ncbi:MAG: sigma-70 family RNA polymerase sigma factor [Armatimonadetes bacterium]|nr:MAG: sigma-70 family RNA polymerase sigma factor [Armatimonadota bacterium]
MLEWRDLQGEKVKEFQASVPFESVEAVDPKAEEAQLVLRTRQGDQNALRELVNRHRVRLIRTAANVLRDPMEAEDVAQEAFLKAFRELHRLRDDRAFASFVYRICVRLCVDRLRVKRAEPAELEPRQEAQGGSIETRMLVEKVLNQLPPDLRLTLVLREMEQMSYEEVAETMGVPVGTVRSRLHTARERFRALWNIATREEESY